MQQRTIAIKPGLLLSCGALCVLGCDDAGTEVSGQSRALVAECAAQSAPPLPADAWVCPAPRTIECSDGSGDFSTLYVADPSDPECEAGALAISDPGPYAVGSHAISVSNQAGDVVCQTTLNVVDTQPPVLTTHTLQLWPPNHKFHNIAVSDCVSVDDACDSSLQGEFIWASSDEPVDDLGDGHHAPDILLGDDCSVVAVRSERAGPRNGRVYTLGVRVVDASGLASEGECKIIVDHDQRGVQGQDDGEAYRVTFDGTQGGPACDGQDDPPSDDDPPADDDPPPAEDEPDAGGPPVVIEDPDLF